MQIEEFRTRYNLLQLQIENTPHIERELRQAAVLIAITHIDNELHVILTRRPTHLRAHPGQVSFPGGKVENNDNSIIHTALREAEEEIALNQSNVEVVGQYPKMNTFTGFEITPVIGLVKQDFTPILDPGEVDEIFTVPLSYLLKSKNRHKKTFKRNGQMYPVYFIQYQDHFIWGATAAMINSLCLQLQNKS
ncbi:CoA pyrophosphatase [Shewanella eurypsychrophilus]|uniref:CoA pyrophosphatase n=1 Tax=Shewanella eurypsychrophilus TaxID=2593656 RepID=A0ABX6V7C6_9GAMM|nr:MULTISPECIES: CoA pyrophosphatase [Shewanella]QFU22944.1 CoA pyrophosphatase [Shewanella sp. YLB-09]QPG58230.1 CoA pyrophosphatase [Shewanella eurypsychrophilus]